MTGYGLYLAGTAHERDDRHERRLHGAPVRHDLHARSGRERRRRHALRRREPLDRDIALRSTPPPPTSTGTVTQTIANGSTSRARQLACRLRPNGDTARGRPRLDRSSCVDGNQVLSENNAPFGDTSGFWASTTVSNGQHTFQVRALNDTGTVLATNTITATVANTTPPPPPPTRRGTVTQTIANGSTVSSVVNWRAVYDANGDGGRGRPRLDRSSCVDGNQVLSEINAPFGDTSAFWATTTVNNGQHTFQVRALNDTGTVLATNTITATVNNQPTPPPDTTAPSQPGNLRVDVGHRHERHDRLERRHRQRRRRPATTSTAPSTKVGTTTTTSLPDQRAHVRNRVLGRRRALDAAGNASPQATMSVTTSACADTQPPTAPSNVTASTRTTTSIALTWAPATDNVGVAGYGVYNGADLVDTTAGTTGIVSGLTCGTNYTLAVDAFDATGNSSPKTAIMVSTLPCTDTTPPTAAHDLRRTARR